MSRQTAPPGKTFNERWPDDVASANYLAGPWVPYALGGLAGIVGIPIVIGAGLLASWLFVLGLVTVVGVLTALVARPGRTPGTVVLRLWRFTTWVLLAGLIGIVALFATGVLCDTAACLEGTRSTPERIVPAVVVFALTVAGSVAAAVGVERAARRLAVR